MLSPSLKSNILKVLCVGLILTGCAGYGKMKTMPRSESESLIKDLIANADQYTVHYHGNSEKIVSGLLFDPNNNGKSIQPKGYLWAPVSDPQAMKEIVGWIRIDDWNGYSARTREIVGPEGDLYGYLFTGWSRLVIKAIDENTVEVYGLEGSSVYLGSADIYDHP